MLVFYMQGGLSFHHAYLLNSEQMESIYETIHEHYERQNNAFNTTKKGG